LALCNSTFSIAASSPYDDTDSLDVRCMILNEPLKVQIFPAGKRYCWGAASQSAHAHPLPRRRALRCA
jgi:hypothetical protein